MKTKRLAILLAATAALMTGAKAADEATALDVLAAADSGLHAKAMACDELGRVGTVKAVPALARLLADEELHDYARDGLERIKDPSAGKALMDGITSLKGNLRVGVIISLGDRREKAAVPVLAKIAMDKAEDKHAVASALSSLRKIADDAAGNAILKVLAEGPDGAKKPAAHAALAAAYRMENEGGSKELSGKLREAAAAAGVSVAMPEKETAAAK